MTGRLDGRTAVVTGAARGLGQAFAVRLAADGARVHIVDKEAADATLEMIAKAGGLAGQTHADLTELEAVPELCRRIVTDVGDIDILVNDAGIYPFQPVPEITFADWRRVFATNLDAPFFLSQGFLPGMRARKWGRIINISSNTVWTMDPNFCHYITSKAAVVGLTRALASEVGNDGVTVNAVAPSLTRTPGTENSPAKDIFDTWRKGQAIDRLEQPTDLVGAVSFFCSDDAAFITGQVLMVDGGMVRAG